MAPHGSMMETVSTWLAQPVVFQSSHTFDCAMMKPEFTAEDCQYYKYYWRNWYVADWSFALPTVAFFMSTIIVFSIGYILTQALSSSSRRRFPLLRNATAAIRYLSYRGFRINALGWNSAPVGVLVLGAIGAAYFFCMDLIPSPYYWPGPSELWGNSPPLGTRSGWLALACMPFLFATASKASWVTLVTGVPHEKLQVFHRWIAYAFLVLALMHTFPFIVWHIRNGDMVLQFTMSNYFTYWTGVVALLFQTWLTVASFGPIRSLGYEFFKAAHFLAAVLFMVIFFWHCGGTLTSWHYFVATAAVYVPCWAYPWVRTLFEYGIGQKAHMVVEENGFLRITIPANFKWQPGQHCFLRFRSFGIHAFSAHPFTICSLPSTSPDKRSEMVFYLRHRGGLTAKLYAYALKNPDVQVPVLVDGPYGGIDNQKYFCSDRVVVVAGGSGAGWMLPFAEQYLRYHALGGNDNRLAQDKEQTEDILRHPKLRGPRSLRLILATRDIATRSWFYATLDQLRSQYPALGAMFDFSVEVHLTREAARIVQAPTKSGSDSTTPPSSSCSYEGTIVTEPNKMDTTDVTQDEVCGRPNLPLIIHEEGSAAAARSTAQAVGVFACGPLTMQHDIRNSVANENLRVMKNSRAGAMYLHLEHFSWA